MKQRETLFEPIPSRVDPISLVNWDRIQLTLTEREDAVMLAVFAYLAQTGFGDVTGGELAIFMGVDKTHVRPRLTGLSDPTRHSPTLLEQTAIRESKAPSEGQCHGYRPTLTKAAYERWRK